MGLRRTLVAVVVLAGLVAFIYYYEYRGEEAREAALDAERRPLNYERDEIQALEIQRPAGLRLRIQREEDGWRMVEPIRTRADDQQIDMLLNNIRLLQIDRKLEDIGQGERGAFGLEKPAGQLILHRLVDEGTEEMTLRVGDEVPAGGGYYAEVSGQDGVLLVTGGVDAVLGAEVGSLRQKKLIGLDQWRIARVVMKGEDGSIVLEKGDDRWRISEPIAFPADRQQVDSILSALGTAEATGFATEEPSDEELGEYGLEPARLSIQVANDEGRQIDATLGRSVNGRIYARRHDMDAVMMIQRNVVSSLVEAAGDPRRLRDHRAAPFARYDLSRIRIERDSARISLFKDEDLRWRWGGEEGPILESATVDDLLDAVERLEAVDFVDDDTVPIVARLEMTFDEGEGETAREIRIEIEEPADGRGRVASSVSTSTYLVEADRMRAVLDAVEAIREPAGTEDEPEESKGPPEESGAAKGENSP